jgi:hypothetical protein
MALQANTNVASTVAKYFSSNFEQYAQSTAFQNDAAAVTAWLNAQRVNGQTPQFYLQSDNSGNFTVGKVAGGQALPSGAYPIEGFAAYAITQAGGSSAGTVAVDWLMARIGQELRQTEAAQTYGPLLTSTPEANVQFDLSSLDTSSLVRLLNLLTGRNRDTMVDVAKGNAQDAKSNIGRLGLAAANLSAAVELQARFAAETGASGALASDSFMTQAHEAMRRLTSAASSDLDAARLAARESITGRQSNERLSRLSQIGLQALNSQLQSAADVAYMINPEIAKFLSDLDVEQNDKDGFVIKTARAVGQEQLVRALKNDLVKALQDPALITALADALAANADDLELTDLSLPEQTTLLQDVAKAVVESMAQDDNYLQDLAAKSVAFHADIAGLIRNEVVAASERDQVAKNV